MTDRPVRVRYAPSPTGPQHLGGVRTALYNYLFARKNKGTFIIRIEDTDQTRFVPGAEEYMLEALNWCGITYDEGPGKDGGFGPYKQSERKHMYRQYADRLIDSGHAYYAFDTAEELDAMRERFKASGMAAAAYNAVTREYMKNSIVLPQDEVKARIENGEPYVIRIKMPRKEEIKFHDMIRGWVTFNSSQLDDKVLFKSDGMPTYHLANVVDDYLMQISHVIRGEEWLPSAPLHVTLYKFLGWEDVMPQFAHLPLILRPDGNGKLSKRDGDRLGFPVFPLNWKDPATGELSVGFRERGFFPEPFTNMIALLGWHPGHLQQEIFTLDEMVQLFSIDHVGKSGARFDYEKAKWFNQEYIKKLDNSLLADALIRVLEQKGNNIPPKDKLELICHSLKERCTFVNELYEQGYYFFEDIRDYDESIVSKKWHNKSKEIFNQLQIELQALPEFHAKAIEALVLDFIKNNQLQNGDVLPLLRIMLSGTKNGPAVYDIAAILGKEKSLERMHIFQQKFPIAW
jgi:glutamyl-tRNA synthetase